MFRFPEAAVAQAKEYVPVSSFEYAHKDLESFRIVPDARHIFTSLRACSFENVLHHWIEHMSNATQPHLLVWVLERDGRSCYRFHCTGPVSDQREIRSFRSKNVL